MYAGSQAGCSSELTLTLKPISLCTNQISVFLLPRFWSLVKQLERGEASAVLEPVYTGETRHLLETEDELGDIQSDSVPLEVQDWLASTFTWQMGMMLKRTEEKPQLRSIVHAVAAGMFVEGSGRISEKPLSPLSLLCCDLHQNLLLKQISLSEHLKTCSRFKLDSLPILPFLTESPLSADILPWG
uniref:PDE1 N-terminal domain-containing protein n=1 Tax=Strix occidentalis caurina TaxID=311401 RepID=A0A8D0FKJ0_STROC